MTTWTLGSATITRVEEQLGVTNRTCTEYFPNFERDVLERHLDWLAPDHYSPQHDRFVTSVHSWLIRVAGLTILLDTCSGNHKDRPWAHRFQQGQGERDTGAPEEGAAGNAMGSAHEVFTFVGRVRWPRSPDSGRARLRYRGRFDQRESPCCA